MSDDEADPELLELLRKSLGLNTAPLREPETGVLKDAQYICDNSIDVALDMYGTRDAARLIRSQMQSRTYSRKTWAEHELHPSVEEVGEEALLDLIFTLDLLNFSFWSELPDEKRFKVEYKGRTWTGYWSLVAALRRAQDEGIKITSPHFWHDEEDLTVSSLVKLFRSATDEEMPMLAQRFSVLKEAGEVLCQVADPHSAYPFALSCRLGWVLMLSTGLRQQHSAVGSVCEQFCCCPGEPACGAFPVFP